MEVVTSRRDCVSTAETDGDGHAEAGGAAEEDGEGDGDVGGKPHGDGSFCEVAPC
jgi:hypothetical protein